MVAIATVVADFLIHPNISYDPYESTNVRGCAITIIVKLSFDLSISYLSGIASEHSGLSVSLTCFGDFVAFFILYLVYNNLKHILLRYGFLPNSLRTYREP